MTINSVWNVLYRAQANKIMLNT